MITALITFAIPAGVASNHIYPLPMPYRLSIVIPARNEICYDIDLLSETVKNLLENTTDAAQIICVLDGYWPREPLPVHPRVTVIHHNQSIGQRAATNEGVRIATGEWTCKLDAHCAVGPEFDVRLLEGAEPHWTIVPGQFNLLAFEWHCSKCGWIKDQSPKPPKCERCNTRQLQQVKIWKPRDGQEGRRRAYTHSWRFDSNLDFQYFGAYASDEAYCKKHKIPFRPETQQPIHDTMSLLGACWAMTKERYLYLDPCDPAFGSWGDMGSEIACKTWLSGGELKVNQNTWFAHFFRVGGIGFPYPDGGRKERAKARGKELWLGNKWPKQIYPLSWLIEKFKPLPDWHTSNNPILEQVNLAGKSFPVVPLLTDDASPVALGGVTGRQEVPPDAMHPSGLIGAGTTPSQKIFFRRDQSEVDGIAAPLSIAGVVDNQNTDAVHLSRNRPNGPGVHNAMEQHLRSSVTNAPITSRSSIASPDPASSVSVYSDSGKDSSDLPNSQMRDSEVFLGSHDSASDAGLRSGPESRCTRDSGPSIITPRLRFTALYYTCNSHDETLELAARNNLRRAVNGHEIGCVSLKRTDFGDWTIVLDREKSGGTMHYQILAGLERSTADYVFLCESDVFYHGSHFQFVPPDNSVIYYNTNVWRVRYQDGHAVRTANLQQVSGICASRELLLDHYRRRVEIIEQNNGQFDVKRMAYEPGTRGKFGDEKIANWQSEYPNLDITGHGNTLTVPHFSIDSFRNKKFAEGWQETDDEIPGWGRISGRIKEFLAAQLDDQSS